MLAVKPSSRLKQSQKRRTSAHAAREISLRQPTVEDLTPEQRRIYDAVPDPLKDLFLAQLPPIDPSTGKKTTEQLEKWLAAAKKVRADLDERIGRVSALVSIARTGRPVDLKRELEPLAVSRVVFRFQRGGVGSSDGAQARAPRTRREAAEAER